MLPHSRHSPADASPWLSEARYQAIVEDQPDLVCRFLPDGTLTYVNRAYCTFFGVARQDIVGRPYQPVVHPDDLADVQKQVATLSAEHPVVSIVNRVFRADGAVRWMEWSNRAFYDETGTLIEVQSAGRDITDRREAEARTAHLAAIVSSADIAIYATTLDGVITSWNRAAERMFGYPAAEAIGQPITMLTRAGRAAEKLDLADRVRRGETIEQIEIEKVTKSGTRIPVSLTISPIVDPTGAIIGISRIARDISAIKALTEAQEQAMRRESEARAAAEEASRLKDEFLAVVSHELRTPVNAMLGWARMLREGVIAQDAWPKALETIERNARIQAQLVEDLLDVSRIVSGQFALRLEPVDVAAVVHAAVEAVQPSATMKAIALHVDAADPSLTVSGDAGRLQQAVWNLLTNAIKFTGKDGRVDVIVRAEGAEALVSVQDTGIGIPNEVLPFIFDRFRQADARTTRAHGGLGLGLTIVEHVVKAHGGSVHAFSEGAGQGTRFDIRLPRVSAASAVAPLTEGPARADLTGRRILVVDDDTDARELARTVLERCHAVVTLAASVTEAIEAANASEPEVLVADIGMPEQDGYQLIRLLRSTDRHGDLRAIALTAFSSPQHRDAALQAGYDVHLSKPLDADRLCATVAQLCASSTHHE